MVRLNKARYDIFHIFENKAKLLEHAVPKLKNKAFEEDNGNPGSHNLDVESL
ncbi:hypothetical protein ACE6H2_015611 [Prunus campanulata]